MDIKPILDAKVDKAMVSDSIPMLDTPGVIASSIATKTVETAIMNAVNTKAPVSHTHTVSDVTGLTAFLADKAGADDYQFYRVGTRMKPIKEYASDAAVLSTSGKFRFYLTDNGLSSGNALFTTGIIIATANLVILDPTGNNYKEVSYTLSGDRKYVDVAVNMQSYPLVSLLGANVSLAPLWVPIVANVTGYLSIKGV